MIHCFEWKLLNWEYCAMFSVKSKYDCSVSNSHCFLHSTPNIYIEWRAKCFHLYSISWGFLYSVWKTLEQVKSWKCNVHVSLSLLHCFCPICHLLAKLKIFVYVATRVFSTYGLWFTNMSFNRAGTNRKSSAYFKTA